MQMPEAGTEEVLSKMLAQKNTTSNVVVSKWKGIFMCLNYI